MALHDILDKMKLEVTTQQDARPEETKEEPEGSLSQTEELKEKEGFEKQFKKLDSSLAVREENDVRIAVIGNVDSGKSTLVGVATKSVLDDGRGLARSKVFNFDHEMKNGRTSSIGQEIMGFDDELK
jgi:GTPase